MTDTAHRFTYHQPEPEQPEVYRLVRDTGYLFALLLETVTKPTRERELALDGIDAAVMHANAAIARHGMADPAYAGDGDVYDQVLGQLSAERPESVLARMPTQADVDAAREHGKADMLAGLQRAISEPVTTPLARVGVLLTDASADYATPDAEPADPWAEKPPYLMLELALRHVQTQLGSGGTGTVGDLLDYIDRVLANDLDAPEDGA